MPTLKKQSTLVVCTMIFACQSGTAQEISTDGWSPTLAEIKSQPKEVWSIIQRDRPKLSQNKWRFYQTVGTILQEANRDADAEKAYLMAISDLQSQTAPLSIGAKVAKAQGEPQSCLTRLYLKQIARLDFKSDTAVQEIFDKAFAKAKPTADLWLAYYMFLMRQGKLEQAQAALSEYRKLKPVGPIGSASANTIVNGRVSRLELEEYFK